MTARLSFLLITAIVLATWMEVNADDIHRTTQSPKPLAPANSGNQGYGQPRQYYKPPYRPQYGKEEYKPQYDKSEDGEE
ncbi:hypothetical protein SprV_0602078600 [Sparganum proliferum]